MNSVEQLEMWRSEPKGDDMPDVSPGQLAENMKAQRLVEQIRQLAEFGKDDVEEKAQDG